MHVLCVAGYGPIVREQRAIEALYLDTLCLALERDWEYPQTAQLAGAKSFALSPMSQAAESCFGTNTRPEAVPSPCVRLEFDVDDSDAASAELKAKGYALLVEARTEPWGQIVTRLLSPEGVLVGLTYTPSMRETE